MTQQTLILIGGPTASGKSALATKLARERRGTIINADAMQVYQGLPLLTAQPSLEDMKAVAHLLYEVTPPGQVSSAGQWLQLAKVAIKQVIEAGRTPILVGGSGLYFDALLGGLADIPAVSGNVRLEAESLFDAVGEAAFRALLAKVDQNAAHKIARNDRQRLVRALSVQRATGSSLSDWQTRSRDATNTHPNEVTLDGQKFQVEFKLLSPNREDLYRACDLRFDDMIARGAVDEVRTLLSQNLPETLPAMKILGVREIASYVRGNVNLEQAVRKAQQMTRNYAKRQMTWFRNQWGCHSPDVLLPDNSVPPSA